MFRWKTETVRSVIHGAFSCKWNDEHLAGPEPMTHPMSAMRNLRGTEQVVGPGAKATPVTARPAVDVIASKSRGSV